MRVGRWKLILPREANTPYTLWIGRYTDSVEQSLLFDLQNDVGEQNDLAAEYPDIVRKLMQEADYRVVSRIAEKIEEHFFGDLDTHKGNSDATPSDATS